MELLFVVIIAASFGLAVRYLVPGRETYGSALLPAIAAAAASIVWEALLWLGFTFDGGWIWLISLVVAPLTALVFAILLPRKRHEADRNMLTRLSGIKA